MRDSLILHVGNRPTDGPKAKFYGFFLDFGLCSQSFGCPLPHPPTLAIHKAEILLVEECQQVIESILIPCISRADMRGSGGLVEICNAKGGGLEIELTRADIFSCVYSESWIGIPLVTYSMEPRRDLLLVVAKIRPEDIHYERIGLADIPHTLIGRFVTHCEEMQIVVE